jgi:hypothetical protein
MFCVVWNPTRLSSAGSDTLQGLVLPGLIPRRILFCGVSDPADKLRPRRTRRKSFESLPFSLKGHFSEIGYMYKLHYPRHIGFMLQEPPIWKYLLSSAGCRPRRTTLKFEYLREFEPEFENVLGYELGAHLGSIHEKNQGPKISCYCTFKLRSTISNKATFVPYTFEEDVKYRLSICSMWQ